MGRKFYIYNTKKVSFWQGFGYFIDFWQKENGDSTQTMCGVPVVDIRA